MERAGATAYLIAAVVACASAGCAHTGEGAPAAESQEADPQPFANPTELMIAIEDGRGLYLPKRPPFVLLDDGAFDEACLRYQHAVSWHAGDEDEWQSSGRAAAAEREFRSECIKMFAFYERAGDRLVIKRDSFRRLPRAKQLELAVHELAHAIQVHALPPRPPPAQMTTDARRAYDALVEGDATFASMAFALRQAGKELSSEVPRMWTSISSDEPKALRDRRFFEYWLGTRFVLDLYQHGGFAAVDEAFAHPPTSTSQIIHANRYLEPQRPPANVASQLPLPPPYVPFATMVRGELELRVLLARCVPPDVAMEVSAEWDGDEFTLAKARPPEPPMSRWVTAWRSEGGAQRFSEVVRSVHACLLPAGVSIAAHDRVVVLVMGPDAAVRQRHAKALLADVLRVVR